ncbi:MAG: hypothetical protein SGI77_08555 [Pirellulaceae bacterium]|nr:hypothetical protein [Pirellulaceae bacterium]
MSRMLNSLKQFAQCSAIAIGISAALLSALGCHPLSGRFRTQGTSIDAASDDDWAPPKTGRYTQPQKYVSRSKQNSDDVSRLPKSNNPLLPAEYQPPKISKIADDSSAKSQPEIAKDESSEATDALDVKETDTHDLDLEGALAALPPNLQEVARRQLQAMKSSRKSEESGINRGGKSKPETKITAKLTDKSESEVIRASYMPSPDPVPASTNVADSAKEPHAVVTATAQKAENQGAVELASAASSKPVANPHWNVSVSEAISTLERDIEQNQTSDENLRLSHEVTLRLLYLSNRQLDDALRPIEGLAANEQDYFRHQLQALYEAGNPDAMPAKRRWSLVMNSQRQATNQLAAASNLEVRSLAFCTDVQGYGMMTKFPNYQFKPDQEILLYCELENVLAEQVKAGFETQLQGNYEIIDPNGRRITDQLLPMEREICQNHRRDYFIIYHIFMPIQIAPGNYQMRVTIEDMKARKFGQANLDFQIQK